MARQQNELVVTYSHSQGLDRNTKWKLKYSRTDQEALGSYEDALQCLRSTEVVRPGNRLTTPNCIGHQTEHLHCNGPGVKHVHIDAIQHLS
jgi:hypothetical protein